MSFNDIKARGKKHRTNKAKYQGKEKETKSKEKSERSDEASSVRGLSSNWDRYEEAEAIETVDESTNFSLLAQTPLSQGGHFVFKSYKNIENESDFEAFMNNKLFALDFQLLGKSLKTIPFNELCDLDTNYLEDETIQQFKHEAAVSAYEYEYFLKDKTLTKVNEVKSDSEDLTSPSDEKSAVKVELEQWLDDILDN